MRRCECTSYRSQFLQSLGVHHMAVVAVQKVNKRQTARLLLLLLQLLALVMCRIK